jgi:hypothetical protein
MRPSYSLSSRAFISTFTPFPRVWDQIAFSHLIPTFGTHRVLSMKITWTMPPRRTSQRLHPNEALRQNLAENHQTIPHPSTQTLSTIPKGPGPSTLGNIPKVQPHQLANMSTTVPNSSQNNGGASSTQTNGGAPHQSPLRAPSLIQLIQGDTEFDQI